LSAAVVVVVCDVVVCVVVVVFDVVVLDVVVVVFDVVVFVVFCVLCFVGLWWAFALVVVDDVVELVTEALVVLDFELEPQAPRVSAAARTARTVVTPVFTVRQLTERRVRQ
jgi:hypothetical protein